MLRVLSKKNPITLGHHLNIFKFSGFERLYQPAFESLRDDVLEADSPIRKFFSQEFLVKYFEKEFEPIRDPKGYSERLERQRREQYGANYCKYESQRVRVITEGIAEKSKIRVKAALADRDNENFNFREKIDYALPISQLDLPEDYIDLANTATQAKYLYGPEQGEHSSIYIPETKLPELCGSLREDEILVFNVPRSTRSFHVHQLMETFGEVKAVKINRCLQGLPASVKVQFANKEEAKRAKSSLHWKYWNDSLLIAKVIALQIKLSEGLDTKACFR